MVGTAHGADRTTAFLHDIRHGLSDSGTALPRLLARLARSTAAAERYADARTNRELLDAVVDGDRAAETALYVRMAGKLDSVATKAAGGSAMDREDLHQEGAERLITDARNGKIRDAFGGEIGPYLGRAVLGHLRNVASTQSPGKPSDPGRFAQKLRQALTKTADEHGEYDITAAAIFAREHFGWTLATFWEIHDRMRSAPVEHRIPTQSGYTVAESMPDRSAEDALARVEAIETARVLRSAGHLSAREREVIDLLCGFGGPVLSEKDTARVLGMTQQAVNKIKRKAFATLRAISDAA
ncbi:hypothetical protein NLX83_13200 [Allokutzneria sp. A3M-2-11 16]|uniref:RNA polymerase sigma factor n=1 Tax=Allokutzneria sp. A3M-2-11 16 TaxID=2962043 RepID=UPI0020B65223|nr:sigma factor-like helix-turn-helix DNA-binding protein [Allokutzneria sp. A3M-2-11 16]MCP3800216.1 hypothetical protein [Allokutzneria sp. A3M-2-11 16]